MYIFIFFFIINLLFFIIFALNKYIYYFNANIIKVKTLILPNINNNPFRIFNPSVFKYKSKINYVYRYTIGGSIINLNRILYLLKNKHGYSNIMINDNILEIDVKYIFGFEDCRSIILNKKLYLICSCRDINYNTNSMYILKINFEKMKIQKYIKLNPSLNEINPQKNWTPFIYKDELYLIYSFNPFIIFKINLKDGTYTTKTNNPKNIYYTDKLYGGSNAIKYKEYYLCITHYRTNYVYTHRFVIFNLEKIIFSSNEFIIDKNKIIFIDKFTKKIIKYCKYLLLIHNIFQD